MLRNPNLNEETKWPRSIGNFTDGAREMKSLLKSPRLFPSTQAYSDVSQPMSKQYLYNCELILRLLIYSNDNPISQFIIEEKSKVPYGILSIVSELPTGVLEAIYILTLYRKTGSEGIFLETSSDSPGSRYPEADLRESSISSGVLFWAHERHGRKIHKMHKYIRHGHIVFPKFLVIG